ncbi:MAG: thiamine pyrophosphate-dependent enzyme [Thermodesulfobacteriota bacterium]|nr:thiamine pyrophosphate-dependent enzyme [Thermodesulfobacteriota bacterium]
MEKIEISPLGNLLREDRIPHIWCSGCGIGLAFSACLRAINGSSIEQDRFIIISGIGCSGRAAGYTYLDSFHTTHGRAIPFATGIKIARPSSKVIVFSGDGDLVAIGGNHLINAARRNIEMVVICINNFNYGMTGGQEGPSTPFKSRTTTTPYGNFESPFNIPYLVESAGAIYIARWTALHVRRLFKSILEAINKKGFSFIEVISACPTSFGRKNKLGNPLEMLKFFHKISVIQNNIHTRKAHLDLSNEIVVGKFVDIERPDFFEQYKEIFGSFPGEEVD